MPADEPEARGISAETTRTQSVRARPALPHDLIASDEVVVSPETRLRYRVGAVLGRGGFGQVYLARRLGRSAAVPPQVALKVSRRIDGWLHEAYFGRLLEGHPRAIAIFDAFPVPRPDGTLLYCLAIEHAPHGDLRTHLRRTGRAFGEPAVRREIASVLQVLGKLHRGQLLHRDLTPMNVFVCAGRSLKLGDFGLVRQQAGRAGAPADALNPMTAPSEIVAGAVPKWRARDDVYQVGQLIGMLVKGDAERRIRTGEVRRLPCSDHLKEIVHRCIGERRKRYETADELIHALRRPPAALRSGAPRTLRGVHLAFTGILSRTRQQAARAAARAGAIVHGGPSALTTVVVRGRPNPQQVAGRDAGLKLMEIKRLREKGHRITLLDEARFWRLVERR